MANKLTPQHYVNMIIYYIETKQDFITKEKVYNYCISQTEELDAGDEQYIQSIIDKLVRQLRHGRYISMQDLVHFRQVKSFRDCMINIEDDIHELRITEEQAKKIINKNISLGDFSL